MTAAGGARGGSHPGVPAEGPYFEHLEVGQVFDAAPALTLTAGHAAVHQAITGDRLRLPLDHELAAAVTGAAPLAHPALVWDVAIGQSTLVTRQVTANLFYRGLAFLRAPLIGDTLSTVTEVAALRQNRQRPGRRPTGLAVLRMTTCDQERRTVLDFWRCAMLPLRDPDLQTGRNDDLDHPIRAATAGAAGSPGPGGLTARWRLDRFRAAVPGPHLAQVTPGASWASGGGDVVSCAPELARLTLNIARVHHDAVAPGPGGPGGRAGRDDPARRAGPAGRDGRLVYGGHVIGIALAQATRALPNLVTVAGWQSCEHLAPVREGDTLRSEVTVEAVQPLLAGGRRLREDDTGREGGPGPDRGGEPGSDRGGLVHLRSVVHADASPADPPGAGPRRVLDWRFAAVMA